VLVLKAGRKAGTGQPGDLCATSRKPMTVSESESTSELFAKLVSWGSEQGGTERWARKGCVA
jgi:hypothetical protein